jgi:hypothetical protein
VGKGLGTELLIAWVLLFSVTFLKELRFWFVCCRFVASYDSITGDERNAALPFATDFVFRIAIVTALRLRHTFSLAPALALVYHMEIVSGSKPIRVKSLFTVPNSQELSHVLALLSMGSVSRQIRVQ